MLQGEWGSKYKAYTSGIYADYRFYIGIPSTSKMIGWNVGVEKRMKKRMKTTVRFRASTRRAYIM